MPETYPGSAVIPAGYMAKRVVARPEWLKAEGVRDIYSVSQCCSKDVIDTRADYVNEFRHNSYWLIDSPEIIRQLGRTHSVDLSGSVLFYYEIHELEYDAEDAEWIPFTADPPFPTQVVVPSVKTLEGYDVVSFKWAGAPECSPLSCNHLATEVETNEHCLLPSFELAESC